MIAVVEQIWDIPLILLGAWYVNRDMGILGGYMTDRKHPTQLLIP
jgi:hypothetical protein